jgi:hypothetical protein
MSFDDLQAQLRSALDQQFAALKQHYEQGIADVRRQAAAEAERQVASQIDAARAEATAKAAEAARAQRNALELELQQQLEQTVKHSVNSVRRTSEIEIEALRRRLVEAVEAERQRGQVALEQERERLQGEAAAQRARLIEAVEAERQRSQAVLDQERERLQADGAAKTAQAVDAERQRAQAIFEQVRERLQGEALAKLTEAVEAERRRGEGAIDQERERLQAEVVAKLAEAVEEERRRGQAEFDQERDRLQAEAVAKLAEAVDTERRRGEAALEQERERLHADAAAQRARVDEAMEAERRRSQQAVEAERQRAQGELDAERARAQNELETVKQLLETEIAGAHTELGSLRTDLIQAREAAAAATAASAAALATAAAAKAAPPPPPPAPTSLARVPDAIRALETASSLSESLDALLQHAGEIAGRAALFLVNGDRLKSWKAIGIPETDVRTVDSSIAGRDLLATAIQAGQATAASGELPAPPFARLTGDQAVAVPLTINGRGVAVLYADTGMAAGGSGWADAVDVITRFASTVAGLRVATRTLDVLRGEAPEGTAAHGNGDESARRYARLLVSEIKLYNEAAVRAGRQQRDLGQRLREEIDRARRLYEERVPAAVGAREQYFHQELVQTLADGDPSLLGS